MYNLYMLYIFDCIYIIYFFFVNNFNLFVVSQLGVKTKYIDTLIKLFLTYLLTLFPCQWIEQKAIKKSKRYLISFCVHRKLPWILYNSIFRVHSRHAQLPGTAWFTRCSLPWVIDHPVQRSRVGYFSVLPRQDLDGKSTVPRCQSTAEASSCNKGFQGIKVPNLQWNWRRNWKQPN